MDERKIIARRIKKAERRIAAGYRQPEGQESEVDRLARLRQALGHSDVKESRETEKLRKA